MGTIILAGDCYTQEQILFTAVAKGLSTGNYFPTTGIMKGQCARAALIGLETNDIRYHIREPQLTAATACGMVMSSGGYLLLETIQQIQCFNGLNTSAASSTAVVFYFA
jgi:hypothetical protein